MTWPKNLLFLMDDSHNIINKGNVNQKKEDSFVNMQ